MSFPFPRFRSGSTLCALLWIGCTAQPEAQTENRRIAERYDTSPIDVNALDTDSATRIRVLAMPVGEVVTRLDSLRFKARSYFAFSRGNRELTQADRYEAHFDANNNYHTVIDGGDGKVEAIGVGDTLYVRHNRGHFRRKASREAEARDRWGALAWSSLRGALEPFFSRLVLEKGPSESLQGRKTVRYRLKLGAPAGEEEQVVSALPVSTLPTAPPSRWRETAKALGLSGDIWIDADTGVVLQSKFEGRLEVEDRDVRPTQLTVRYQSEILEPSIAPAVESPPKSREEYSRTPRPVDRLSFFRDRIPLEEAETESRRP